MVVFSAAARVPSAEEWLLRRKTHEMLQALAIGMLLTIHFGCLASGTAKRLGGENGGSLRHSNVLDGICAKECDQLPELDRLTDASGTPLPILVFVVGQEGVGHHSVRSLVELLHQGRLLNQTVHVDSDPSHAGPSPPLQNRGFVRHPAPTERPSGWTGCFGAAVCDHADTSNTGPAVVTDRYLITPQSLHRVIPAPFVLMHPDDQEAMLKEMYYSRMETVEASKALIIDTTNSFPFFRPANAHSHPDLWAILQLHRRFFDVRLLVLHRHPVDAMNSALRRFPRGVDVGTYARDVEKILLMLRQVIRTHDPLRVMHFSFECLTYSLECVTMFAGQLRRLFGLPVELNARMEAWVTKRIKIQPRPSIRHGSGRPHPWSSLVESWFAHRSQLLDWTEDLSACQRWRASPCTEVESQCSNPNNV